MQGLYIFAFRSGGAGNETTEVGLDRLVAKQQLEVAS